MCAKIKSTKFKLCPKLIAVSAMTMTTAFQACISEAQQLPQDRSDSNISWAEQVAALNWINKYCSARLTVRGKSSLSVFWRNRNPRQDAVQRYIDAHSRRVLNLDLINSTNRSKLRFRMS